MKVDEYKRKYEALAKRTTENENSVDAKQLVLAQQQWAKNFVTNEDFKKILDQYKISPPEKKNTLKPNLIRPSSLGLDFTPIIFGPTVQLEWAPVASINDPTYKIQVAKNKDFSEDNVIFETTRDKFTVSNFPLCSKQIINNCGKGKLFWRVAIASATEKSQNNPSLSWSDPQGFYFYKDALDRIKSTKKVIVGMASSYDGIFLEEDKKNGGFKGYNKGFAKALAKNLIPENTDDLEVKFEMFGWPEIFNGLKNKRVDMLIAGVSITEDRKLHYGIIYSEPYFKTTLGVILQTKIFDSETTEETLEDALKGQKISVRSRTTSVDLARELNTQVIEVSSMAAAIKDVLSASSYGAIMDEEFAKEEISINNTGESLTFHELKKDTYGVVVSWQETALLNKINEQISRMNKEGKIDSLFSEYFSKKETNK